MAAAFQRRGEPMIVLFTDFGAEGPYVGRMKAVLAQGAPGNAAFPRLSRPRSLRSRGRAAPQASNDWIPVASNSVMSIALVTCGMVLAVAIRAAPASTTSR